MKHLVIGGPSRSGKTILSMMLSKKLIHYKMDSIKRGIEDNFCNEIRDRKEMSIKMAHLISTIIVESNTDSIKNKEFFVIDTCHLYPKDIYEKKLENTVIIFLGYPNASIENKLKEIRKYDNSNIWSNTYSDEELKYGIKLGIEYSKLALKECEEYNIKFFDISNNFEETINEAYKYIRKRIRK